MWIIGMFGLIAMTFVVVVVPWTADVGFVSRRLRYPRFPQDLVIPGVRIVNVDSQADRWRRDRIGENAMYAMLLVVAWLISMATDTYWLAPVGIGTVVMTVSYGWPCTVGRAVEVVSSERLWRVWAYLIGSVTITFFGLWATYSILLQLDKEPTWTLGWILLIPTAYLPIMAGARIRGISLKEVRQMIRQNGLWKASDSNVIYLRAQNESMKFLDQVFRGALEHFDVFSVTADLRQLTTDGTGAKAGERAWNLEPMVIATSERRTGIYEGIQSLLNQCVPGQWQVLFAPCDPEDERGRVAALSEQLNLGLPSITEPKILSGLIAVANVRNGEPVIYLSRRRDMHAYNAAVAMARKFRQ